ncbi:MAG: DUF6145 family protein [Lachnospiraceae bacterium]|nr:DUF6145 family protein [Lachnospiraceae bacterium]
MSDNNQFKDIKDNGELSDGRVVLCGANAYEQKYYFNKKFSKLPESIQKELHIICVLFTEEVGGLFYIVFDEEGGVSLETNADSDDIYYDDISSGLLIGEIRRNRAELLESLSIYYRMAILGEKPEDLLSEFESGEE